MKIVEQLPTTAPEGETVWVMSGTATGWQYTMNNGIWKVTAGMACPYIPREIGDGSWDTTTQK